MPATLRKYRAGLFMEIFNVLTWQIALHVPMVLLAEALGANALHVGVLSSFVFILLPAQLISTLWITKIGLKRQTIYGWTGRSLCLIPVIYIASQASTEDPKLLFAFSLCLFLFCLCRAIGVAGLLPWIYQWVQAESRGKYFTQQQSMIGVGGVLTLLVSAAVFHYFPAFECFIILYSMAFIGSLITLYCMSRIPDAEKKESIHIKDIYREFSKVCYRKGPLRFYLGFRILTASVAFAYPAFTTFYLKAEAGLSYFEIIIYQISMYLGLVAVGPLARLYIDHKGYRFTFRISLALSFMSYLYWLFLIFEPEALYPWLWASYLLSGLALGHMMCAHNKYLAQVCSDKNKALQVSIFSTVSHTIGGITPILWGSLLKADPGSSQALYLPDWIGFFACGLLTCIGAFYAIRHMLPDSYATGK